MISKAGFQYLEYLDRTRIASVLNVVVVIKSVGVFVVMVAVVSTGLVVSMVLVVFVVSLGVVCSGVFPVVDSNGMDEVVGSFSHSN